MGKIRVPGVLFLGPSRKQAEPKSLMKVPSVKQVITKYSLICWQRAFRHLCHLRFLLQLSL